MMNILIHDSLVWLYHSASTHFAIGAIYFVSAFLSLFFLLLKMLVFLFA